MHSPLKVKVAKAVVPAIDAMNLAIRYGFPIGNWEHLTLEGLSYYYANVIWTPYDASGFETKPIPPKQIRKMRLDLFDHQDHNVRPCAKGLTIEHCWIRKDEVENILCDKMQTYIMWQHVKHAGRKELSSLAHYPHVMLHFVDCRLDLVLSLQVFGLTLFPFNLT